jgi:16S rRNA (cytidine1402-2'-O)-methyltransferase
MTAVVASGLPAERWSFVGFLPRKKGELAALFGSREMLVAFESPRRVAASLALLSELHPERRVAVCRELTKLHEEVIRGKAADVAAECSSRELKGEIVLVVEGVKSQKGKEPSAGEIGVLHKLIEAGLKPRAAAGIVAELTDSSANALYRALQ